MNFSERIIETIKSIKFGNVLSYKEVAELAGNPNGARQVARILHTSSKKYNLPWHRVVNSSMKVSIKDPYSFNLQIKLLRSEGLIVSDNGQVIIGII
ncbi:MGMT family protein [Mycoplasmatota bacterium]|nr:MGMT family protein [Mycoplasmatota bacterium]